MSGRVPPFFRTYWLALTFGSWGLVSYLATHESRVPDVLGRYSWLYFGALSAVFATAILVSLANLDRPVRWLARAATPLMVLPLSVLVSLMLAETFLRSVDPLGLSYVEEMTRHILERVPDPELLYRHRRNWVTRYQGVEVRFNEVGLRDVAIEPKGPGEFRILVLGDSVTFGWGVPHEDTFPARLERILSPALARPVRVINAGHCSFNTTQELRYLRRDGYRLEPDLLLLVYLENDTLPMPDTYDPWSLAEPRAPHERIQRRVQRTYLYQLVRRRADLLSRLLEPRAGNSPFDPAARTEPGWLASTEALSEIALSAERHGIALGVVLFDWFSTAALVALEEDVRRAVAPFPVEDTVPWFEGRDVAGLVNSVTDPHPNSEGHAILATGMARFVRDHWGPEKHVGLE